MFIGIWVDIWLIMNIFFFVLGWNVDLYIFLDFYICVLVVFEGFFFCLLVKDKF